MMIVLRRGKVPAASSGAGTCPYGRKKIPVNFDNNGQTLYL